MEYIVYCYTNKITGKRYIGLTSLGLDVRAGDNGTRYRNCPYFYNAIQKYGWNNFERVVLADNLSHDEACRLEQYYIKEYNTVAPNGYNLTCGGDSGFHHTEDTKRKISAHNKGNKSRTGYRNSEINNQRASERMKGNQYGKKHGRPVLQYSLTGKFIAEFPSAADAIRATGITSVKKAVRGEYKTAGGYVWRRKGM